MCVCARAHDRSGLSHKSQRHQAAWCGVLKALLPEGNGRDVYPRVQVNGRAVCLSARCVLLYSRDLCTVALGRYCSADACALSHRV